MKTESDKIWAETLSPQIFNPKSVNTDLDPTLLSNDYLQKAENVIFDYGIIETIPGTNKINNDTVNSPVTGLHRSYGPGDEKVLLRLANGELKSGPPSFSTTVLSGLSTDKITTFINIKGKSYGVNEEDGLIRYDPKTQTGIVASIIPPDLRKKIAFFESDENWSGGTANTGWFRPDEWEGNAVQSRKLTADASGSDSMTLNINLDLTEFDNGKEVNDNDLICFYTKHNILNNIDYITLEFSSGDTTFTDYYIITIYDKDFPPTNHEENEFRVRRGAFISNGSPSWANIKAIRITIYANANGPVSISFDMLCLRASPIIARELKIDVFNCEDNDQETWGNDAIPTNETSYMGNRSVKVAGTAGGSPRTATLLLTNPINISEWPDGVDTATSDEFVFYIRTNDTAAITDANCLTLKIGTDDSNYYYYTWATKNALGLTGNNQWIKVEITKADISANYVGSPDWSNISFIQFVTSNITGTTKYLYFDYMTFERNSEVYQIADMEMDEDWQFTGNGCRSAGAATEGSYGIALYGSKSGAITSTATLAFSSALDLTKLPTGGVSTDDDFICFDLYAFMNSSEVKRFVDKLIVYFDCNSTDTFVNCYKYVVDLTTYPANDRKWLNRYLATKTTIRIRKSAFELIGSGSWATIGAVKFEATVSGNYTWGAGYIFIDNLILTRKGGPVGTFIYKYAFLIGDVYSSFSEPSEEFVTKNNSIYLSEIKTSQDSRVTGRAIFRLGGTLTEWVLVKIIEDNVTTTYIDNADDEDLYIPIGDEIPTGHVEAVLGNNLCYDPTEDRLIIWGDPNHKNYVWYSKPGNYLSVGEDDYRIFKDQVMGVIPWYGVKIILYKNGIQKVMGSIETGEISDLPATEGACSYWSFISTANAIFYVGWNNFYICDGTRSVAIGDPISNYFRGRESYLNTINLGYNKDTIYIACKDKVGSPTYNNTVIRYYIPTKSFSIINGWNVNVWANLNQADDTNDLYYGDSVSGDVYSINFSNYLFGGDKIISEIILPWLNLPDSEIAIHKIEFKAKGTDSSDLIFYGYKDLSLTPLVSGTISLNTSWQTFIVGPKNIHNKLRGDNITIGFKQETSEAYFKLKDIVIYLEKIPKRMDINEVVVT